MSDYRAANRVADLFPSRRWARFAALSIACVAAWVFPTAMAADALDPGEIEGLVAWWAADALSLNNGDKVQVWPDKTGLNHDLTVSSGVAPDYYQSRINRKPVVYVRDGTMSVSEPFALLDHTVFIVYKPEGAPLKAFFHGGSDFQGIMLERGEQRLAAYLAGGPRAESQINYNTSSPATDGFRITVLGRESAGFRSWINGQDVSSNVEYPETIQVNAFFFLKQTTYSTRTGNGLLIAEMLFFDRFLDGDDRASVTGYLASKYDVATAGAALEEEGGVEYVQSVGTALAQLSTTTSININGDEIVVIPWDVQDDLDSPFHHDPETEPSRLTCVEDGARARLHVSLPVTSSVPGTNVRVLFRLNGSAFLRGEGRTGPLGATDGPHKASVTAEVVTPLSAGDYVEVVTMRAGAKGEVKIEPGAAVFIAEAK